MNTEPSKDIVSSFVIEFIWTSVLLLVIYLNFSPDSKYRKNLQVNKKDVNSYTYGPIITGAVLMCLIYASVWIGKKTNIWAGHMFPLITIPSMSSDFGVGTVSFTKGIVMLFAQFLSMFVIWYLVFRTSTFN